MQNRTNDEVIMVLLSTFGKLKSFRLKKGRPLARWTTTIRNWIWFCAQVYVFLRNIPTHIHSKSEGNEKLLFPTVLATDNRNLKEWGQIQPQPHDFGCETLLNMLCYGLYGETRCPGPSLTAMCYGGGGGSIKTTLYDPCFR